MLRSSEQVNYFDWTIIFKYHTCQTNFFYMNSEFNHTIQAYKAKSVDQSLAQKPNKQGRYEEDNTIIQVKLFDGWNRTNWQ